MIIKAVVYINMFTSQTLNLVSLTILYTGYTCLTQFLISKQNDYIQEIQNSYRKMSEKNANDICGI